MATNRMRKIWCRVIFLLNMSSKRECHRAALSVSLTPSLALELIAVGRPAVAKRIAESENASVKRFRLDASADSSIPTDPQAFADAILPLPHSEAVELLGSTLVKLADRKSPPGLLVAFVLVAHERPELYRDASIVELVLGFLDRNVTSMFKIKATPTLRTFACNVLLIAFQSVSLWPVEFVKVRSDSVYKSSQ